jgi:hypothetical protein
VQYQPHTHSGAAFSKAKAHDYVVNDGYGDELQPEISEPYFEVFPPHPEFEEESK